MANSRNQRGERLRAFLKKGLLMDGAMGTELIARTNAAAGFVPEDCLFSCPDVVKAIHADYLRAGARLICTNTFGANPLKSPKDWQKKLSAGLEIACAAAATAESETETERFVALDVGPTGRVVGDNLSFDDAVDCYKAAITTAIAAKAKADCVYIETMTDLSELRAALIAAKEVSDLPILCSMSFEKSGRSVFGTSVAAYAVTAASLGADAVGINCSLGPCELPDNARTLIEWCALPVFLKPNAGMPTLVNGNTVYNLTPDAFFSGMEKIARLGYKILGGCCGTTPAHIRKLAPLVENDLLSNDERSALTALQNAKRGAFSSAYNAVLCPKILGERINPTGKPLLKQALKERDTDYILSLADAQIEDGAELLDVNMGFNEVSEYESMERAIVALGKSVRTPLCIDTSDPVTLERALRLYNGRALINSFNGAKESIATVLPIAKKYGAAVIGLCLDERGVPETATERLEIAHRLVKAAESYGIAKEDVYIDTLTMAQSAGRDNAPTTLKTLKEVHAMGVKTVLGVSNVSFGMPNRADINAKFLLMAQAAGLDLCIINPELTRLRGSKAAEEFLLGEEGATERYLAFAAGAAAEETAGKAAETLFDAVMRGRKGDAARLCEQALAEFAPGDVIEKQIIPALNRVGELYESGKTFLPQLIASSEAAKAAFTPITAILSENGTAESDRRFVVASVQGDVHDIGKNIVSTVAANYGYKVIDLGRDVKIEDVVTAAKANYPCVVGLSALMTTTAVNMKKTIAALKSELPEITVLVGGAVLTPQYAKEIGGVYCGDAAATVRALNAVFGKAKQ